MKLLKYISLAGLSVLGISAVTGCGTETVPPGHEAVIYDHPRFWGNNGVREKPAEPGRYWAWATTDYINVDVRPKAYTEHIRVRMQDNLNVDFEVTLRANPEVGETPGLVQQVGADWYDVFIKPEFLSLTRETISQYVSEGVQLHRDEISATIQNGLEEIAEGRHVDIVSIVVGNIDFPNVVDREIERKLAAGQELERKATELDIEKKKAEIRVAEAEGIAEAQSIINQTLTTNYLQHEAIRAYAELANSENTTFIIMPTSTEGAGMPIIIDADE